MWGYEILQNLINRGGTGVGKFLKIEDTSGGGGNFI